VERVLGIGGVFFRSERPDELRAWYARHLGVELQPYGGVTFRAEAGDVRRFGWARDLEGRLLELWQPPPGRYPEG